MFNRKKIETLERRIKNLELTVQRLEGYLGPLESHNSTKMFMLMRTFKLIIV